MDSARAACRTCHVKVSKITEPDGTEWWGHPHDNTSHKVVPVELPWKEIVRLCDLCMALRPAWAYPLLAHAHTTKWSPDLGVNVTALDTDAWWLICDECAQLVNARDKIALRNKALAVLRKRLPDMTQWEAQSVLLQLAAFWGGQPGSPVEASLLDDMEGEG